jgi:hypothetical protein
LHSPAQADILVANGEQEAYRVLTWCDDVLAAGDNSSTVQE